jgi:guanylate kinase
MSNSSTRPKRRGLLLVISSPSGAGKTSLSKRLVESFEDLHLSISATTRAPRPGEQNGREYWFVDEGEFHAMIERGDFLEWAEVHGHAYGSPKNAVMSLLQKGCDVLFDIDWQGADAVARAAPEDTARVFILPPSMMALAKRLRTRAQDSESVISRRLSRAKEEISHWRDYDYVIVNDVFDHTFEQLSGIYLAEKLRRQRNIWLDTFVAGLLAEP